MAVYSKTVRGVYCGIRYEISMDVYVMLNKTYNTVKDVIAFFGVLKETFMSVYSMKHIGSYSVRDKYGCILYEICVAVFEEIRVCLLYTSDAADD